MHYTNGWKKFGNCKITTILMSNEVKPTHIHIKDK